MRSLTSRFAAVRVRPAHRDYWRSAPRPEEWFLIEWPAGRGRAEQILALDPAAGYPAGDLVDQAKLVRFRLGWNWPQNSSPRNVLNVPDFHFLFLLPDSASRYN